MQGVPALRNNASHFTSYVTTVSIVDGALQNQGLPKSGMSTKIFDLLIMGLPC